MKNTIKEIMNTNYIAAITKSVLSAITSQVVDDLVLDIQKNQDDGLEWDEIAENMKAKLAEIINSLPKIDTPIAAPAYVAPAQRPLSNTTTALPTGPVNAPAARPQGPGSRGSTRVDKDKFPHPSGTGYIKCEGTYKTTGAACRNDAKERIEEGGVVKHYCGQHAKSLQSTPSAQPNAVRAGAAAPARNASTFSAAVASAPMLNAGTLSLDDGDVQTIN